MYQWKGESGYFVELDKSRCSARELEVLAAGLAMNFGLRFEDVLSEVNSGIVPIRVDAEVRLFVCEQCSSVIREG